MPESRRGTLEPLGFDATAVVIDRVIELEKSSSALIVGVRVKLTVRLSMFFLTLTLYLLPTCLSSPSQVLIHLQLYSTTTSEHHRSAETPGWRVGQEL